MAEQKTKKVAALRITARSESFWRAGLQFTREPREVPLSSLSKQQVEALKAEPMLVCEVCEIEGGDGA